MLLLLLAQTSALLAEGPDLKDVERAVDKCDRDAMARIFSVEPRRRRAALIALFDEQQAIVTERHAIAQRRLDAMSRPQDALPQKPDPQGAATASDDIETQLLANRQQALDDARLLNGMRESALDMMRQHYLVSCNNGLASASK